MMVFSAKVTKAKLLILAACCCCLALVIILAVPANSSKTNAQTSNLAKTNEDRVSFLEQYGWDVSDEPVEVTDVVIPTTFDSTYETYNTLQKSQGLDLENYKGEKATRYTYEVTNYEPEQTSAVQANILVVKDKVVAGDISSSAMGGFMHGFEKPKQNSQATNTGSSVEEALDSLNEYSDK